MHYHGGALSQENPYCGTVKAHALDEAEKRTLNLLWVKFSILLVLWGAAFIPVYPALVWTWMNHSNNSHGMLVPLISGFLVWCNRERLRGVRISNSGWGLLVLVLSMVIYVLSLWGGVAVTARAMIVFSLVGLVWYNLGNKVVSLLAFPLLYLLFMVPVPDSIIGLVSFPLQLFATKVSAYLINLLSIPVYREGNILYFVHTQFEVAEACSGIRSLMAFLMLGCFFAFFMGRKARWGQAGLILATVPLALFANIVRVTGTGILAHFYGDRVARGFLHEFSGEAVFALGFFLLLAVYLVLSRVGPQDGPSEVLQEDKTIQR
jgi:exosortase